MTRYFIKEDEQRPDSAHDWWLRKDQYIIGKLYLGRSEAQQIAHQCNTYAELLAACEGALDSLEYIKRNHPDLSGYGVRQERIDQLHIAIARAKGES